MCCIPASAGHSVPAANRHNELVNMLAKYTHAFSIPLTTR